MEELTPKEIVDRLDNFIIGQQEAKKSVAIALRNRHRRNKLGSDLKEEVVPKNILMIGPTGVGKTEIARRLARMVNAPFVKVEATKFTEVGYVGRDVESMIRELVQNSIRIVEEEQKNEVMDKAEKQANRRLVHLLVPDKKTKNKPKSQNPFEAIFGNVDTDENESLTNENQEEQQESDQEQKENIREQRKEMKRRLDAGLLEEEYVEIEVEEQTGTDNPMFGGQGLEDMGINFQDLLGNLLPKQKKQKRLKVKHAREVLKQEEADKLIDREQVNREGLNRAEHYGIVFLDEMDKITAKGKSGPDVSREGVQRDILPIVEGSTISTKYGSIRTDYIMFIGAGAFHESKPSDLIPELQGRFPIRVELESLEKSDFYRIMTEPKNALMVQYQALLETEGVTIKFLDEALWKLAQMAESVNEHTEDIGARRLYTLLEKLMEDISFDAPEMWGQEVTISENYVEEQLSSIVNKEDLSRFIL